MFPRFTLRIPCSGRAGPRSLVRAAWTQLATAAQTSPNKLLAQAVADWGEEEAKARLQIQALEAEIQDLRQQEQRQRQALLLLDEATLNKVMRYESHLTRQLLQLLHTLERLQAARAGLPVQPPAVLDVTVETSQEMPPASRGQRGADLAASRDGRILASFGRNGSRGQTARSPEVGPHAGAAKADWRR